MMRCAGILLCALVLWCGAHECRAQTVASPELIARSKDLDGSNVTFAGEVIGDVMRRGDHAWVNVNDGENAIGIWVPAAAAAGIHITGDFKHTGDVVEISGVLNRACAQHGGDLDIHAQTMRIVTPGSLRTTCGTNKIKKDWVLKLLGVVAVVWILTLLKLK